MFKQTILSFSALALSATFAWSNGSNLVDSADAAKAKLEADWTPPAPEQSATATRKRRAPTNVQHGVADRVLSSAPQDKDVTALSAFAEPIRPVPGSSSPAETAALANALRTYLNAGESEAVGPLVQFTQNYPESRWTPGILLNLGTISYNTGYFSKALEHWWSAWEATKDQSDSVSVAIGSQAVAEYAKMCARIGRKDVLAPLFEELEHRNFTGDAEVKLGSAQQGLWTMQNKPGISFRCGPYALANIAPILGGVSGEQLGTFLDDVQSPDTGFSLNEVEAMSANLGLELIKAKREPGAPVILPAVVHWKVGHYGALTRELNGKYLLEDPTFGNHTWLSVDALDAEGSGFFLIPAQTLPSGWSAADDTEASLIYGKGHSGAGGENETAKCDHKSGGDDCGSLAMARYSFHTLLASLSISDTPVGYTPAYGPEVRVNVTYNQREEGQPSLMLYSNFSPKWVSNWVSYLVDNTSSPGADVTLYQRGGGSEVFTDFDNQTDTYGLDPQSSSYLVMLTANTYKKVFADGTEHYYEHYMGTVGANRRVFLSRIRDPQDNEVTVEYDSTITTGARIKYIHDATGLTTEFFYNHPWNEFLVTSVEDPYGRTATFTYSSVNGVVRLTDIEDVYGIVSSFGYDDGDGITRLTTPYGTTVFELSGFKIGASFDLIRYIEATDPYGDKERIEYNLSAAQTGFPNTINEPLPDSNIVDYRTTDNDDRNSFFWDKQQMKYGAGDHSKAHLYHWVNEFGATDTATSILESEKPPLEGRIWYNYAGQAGPDSQGDLDKPSIVARLVEDENGTAVTQAYLYEYNDLGNVTKMTDPKGRETVIEYAANNIDVRYVKQWVGGTTYETLAEFTYNSGDPDHRPRTYVDAGGNTTIFSYTNEGQIKTVTNELGEVITFTYETNVNNNGYGKVLTITGDVPGGNMTYTYDSFDRIRTATDSEGHTLTYDYDALDRVTIITYPDTSYEQFDYQNHSLVASRDREGRWTRYFHDALMRPVLERDPLGQLTQYEWCRCGDIRKLIDGEGNITHWIRDIQGRVTAKKLADDTTMDYTYYPSSGQLHTVTDALNQVATHSYFIDGNLAEIDYSTANTPDESFTYETYYDRVASMIDGIGTTGFVYHPNDSSTDGAGLVARVNGPFSDDTLKYSYDGLNRLKKREIVDDATFTTASYSEEFVFDARGRVEDVINNLGTFDYFYVGQSSRIDYVDYPNGMKTDYTYANVSGDHLIQQIQYLNSAGTPGVISQFDYTYRQDRNIETWTTTQNAAPAPVAKEWTFGYDDALQLATAVRTNTSTQAVLEQFTYGYDKAGNRTSVTTGSANTNYPANSLNQTTSEQGFGETRFSGTLDEPALVTVNGQSATVMSDGGSAPYTFEALVDLAEGSNTVTIEATDGNGNIATQSYSVTAGGVQKTLEYDLNGNLRFEKDASGTVLREFQWDAKNRLLKIIDGTHDTEFVYDGLDRRVRIIETANSIEQSNNVYIWGSSQIVQKRNSAGSTLERSYYRAGFEEGGNDYYYTKDHLGSIREVVASDGTTVEAVYDYSPWGEVSKIGGSGVESDFLYTGHFYHVESDLHLTLYRAYNPELGMWLSRDPIEEVTGELAEMLTDGANLYAYVGNNSINYTDPDGLQKSRAGWLPPRARQPGYEHWYPKANRKINQCIQDARNSPIGQWVETVGGTTLPGSSLSPVVGGAEAIGGIVEMAPDLKRNRDTIDALLEGDLDKASELQCGR
jgi:RHS repeat-associated protein